MKAPEKRACTVILNYGAGWVPAKEFAAEEDDQVGDLEAGDRTGIDI